MRVLVGLVFGLVTGCTKPNPRSCIDGTCTDPAFPFCDVDGTFGDTTDTCVAVDCRPGEVAACRDDLAIRCNATGNDYDLVQCELGCDAATGGCKGCSSDDQCNNPSPVCEMTTNTCRPCAVDDECASRVCDVDTGACLADSQIAYASPTSGAADPCTLAMPCSLTEAVVIASGNASRSTVRMLPGVYSAPLMITNATISLVGVGATHQVAPGTRSLEIGDGASVSVRGLTIDMPAGGAISEGLLCNGTPNAAALSLRDLAITASQSITVARCSLNLRDVDVDFASGANLSRSTAPTALDAERVRFAGTMNPQIVTAGGDVRVVNSVFDNMAFNFEGGTLAFAFNTVFINGTGSFVMNCNSDGVNPALIENNVLHKIGTTGVQNALQTQGTTCTANHNVLSPQNTSIPGNNIVMNPMMVDPTNHDFHLQSGSPAIDVAVPSTDLQPDDDFERISRPQGLGFDIGAFERAR